MNLTDPITDILVVDDDKLVSLVVSAGLRRKTALPVTPHSNGKSALDQVTATPAKIFMVLLDLTMPVMNGWEFLEAYRDLPEEQTRQIKILMLTTSINPDEERRAIDIPVVKGFIHKPLTPEKLEKAINVYIF